MWLEAIKPYTNEVSLIVAVILSIAILSASHYWLIRRHSHIGAEAKLPRQMLMLGLTLLAIVLLVLFLPVSDTVKGQVLSLLGVVLTGIIAFSSTSFVSNAMAGLLLRTVNSFRPGDFIRVGDSFGRVTERGLFHTEIQTEDRDLTTLPNLYLLTNPLTVVHESGTLISATVSLGYDVDHITIEERLMKAAEATGLIESFVYVTELGDYSVVYRVSGFLKDVKSLLTARSNLRKHMMDCLHEGGIEIVSPSFMNQRVQAADKVCIPSRKQKHKSKKVLLDEVAPETLMFDKAELAQQHEESKAKLLELQQEIEQLRSDREHSDKELEQNQITKRIDTLKSQVVLIEKALDASDDASPL